MYYLTSSSVTEIQIHNKCGGMKCVSVNRILMRLMHVVPTWRVCYIYTFFFTHKTAWLDSSLFVELIQRRLNIYAPSRRLKTTFHFVEKNALKYNGYIIML